MLPKNRLRYKYLENLRIFREKTHNMTGILPNVTLPFFVNNDLVWIICCEL